ncbi:uncharacterized protein LOC131880813 [Tigriopus californicus]|uniref:uncharacterized protein LOC131880813 n=1 Tax=Tigriopus californicus TaxID=6832 RepID=UPI0027DAABF5|nr:uncharacterized protein LOC131880813 [Tigriopus californicus]
MASVPVLIGQNLTFQCADDGYFEEQDTAVNKSFSVACQTGGIYPSIAPYPVCTTQKKCVDPFNHTVPNLRVISLTSVFSNDTFIYRDTIQYDCDAREFELQRARDGYVYPGGTHEANCLFNRLWDTQATDLKCERIACDYPPLPDPTHDLELIPPQDIVRFGDSVTYQCRKGGSLVNAFANWTFDLPCVESLGNYSDTAPFPYCVRSTTCDDPVPDEVSETEGAYMKPSEPAWRGQCFWKGYKITSSLSVPETSIGSLDDCFDDCRKNENCHFFSFQLDQSTCKLRSDTNELLLERDLTSAFGTPLCGKFVNSTSFRVSVNQNNNSLWDSSTLDMIIDGSLGSIARFKDNLLLPLEIDIDFGEDLYVDGVTMIFSGNTNIELKYRSSSGMPNFQETVTKEKRVSNIAITWIFKHPHLTSQFQVVGDQNTSIDIFEFIPHFSDMALFPPVKDCSEVYRLGFHQSGSFLIDPSGNRSPSKAVRVWCELGWTTMLIRHKDGLLSNETHYFDGSNDMTKYQATTLDSNAGHSINEYWIGLDNLHNIVAGSDHEMIVNLWDAHGKWAQAHYQTFSIGNKSSNYALTLRGFQNSTGMSEAGDSLGDQSGLAFSLNGNSSCNVKHLASGWLEEKSDMGGICTRANIFGNNEQKPDDSDHQIAWRSFRGSHRNLGYVNVQIRPKNFIGTEALADESTLLSHIENAKKGQFSSKFR